VKGYKRRALGKPDYWKVAVWSPSLFCWRDGDRQFDTKEEAVQSCLGLSGKYRLSFVADNKPRRDIEVLEILG